MKEKNTVSAAEMKEIERIADKKGLSYRQMMENAGTAAYEVMRQRWPDTRRIVIFAGKGNNGGDGFVIARLYASFFAGSEGGADAPEAGETGANGMGEASPQSGGREGEITVVLCEGEPATVDAEYNLGLLRGRKTKYLTVMSLDRYKESVNKTEDSPCCVRTFSGKFLSEPAPKTKDGGIQMSLRGMQAELIVDALYGTGFQGALRENGIAAAALINESGALVCALDLPSGINADTGQIAEGAVKADLTIAFHREKHGHRSAEAAPYCGEVVTVGIGIDEMEDKPVF